MASLVEGWFEFLMVLQLDGGDRPVVASGAVTVDSVSYCKRTTIAIEIVKQRDFV